MTELKVKCESCGHLQRLFDYDKHTFDIPANQNKAFIQWLENRDKQIRAEVIDEILEHKLIIIDDDGQMWKVVSVGDIERIKEQNK